MPKSLSVPPPESAQSDFRFLRKFVRCIWIVFVLAVACYAIQGIVCFPQLLQPPPVPIVAANDNSLEQAMCMLDLSALSDPVGTWQFIDDADAEPLLPFPDETRPLGSRLDSNGNPVFQFFSVETSSEPLITFWKNKGFLVKEYEATSQSPFFVQCIRSDRILNVWSTDSPQHLQSLTVFKGK